MFIVLNTLNYESVPMDGVECLLLLLGLSILDKICILELGHMFYLADPKGELFWLEYLLFSI